MLWQQVSNALITEEEDVQNSELKEGWYQDEEGNYYYYQNGEYRHVFRIQTR